MANFINFWRLAALLAVGILCVAERAEAQENFYRLTPPLRLAARTVQEVANLATDQSEAFRPRQPGKKPTVVAVEGFCLVTLRDQQQWVKGSPKIGAIRGDKRYLFSSERALAIFAAAPEQYLPVLDGDCIVTFAETGKRESGQLPWGLLHGRRLFFFAGPEELERFKENPEHYVDADLINGGHCIVCKTDEHRVVSGLPETVVSVAGMRYFFASAHHRRLFQSRPEHYIGEETPVSDAQIAIDLSASQDALAEAPKFGDTDSQASTSPLKSASDKKGKKAKKSGDREQSAEQGEQRAMAGYCPVTIRTQGLWQRGKSKFKSTYDGRVYSLTGPEEQSAFKANPREYIPVLGGDSVVSWVDDYERVQGSVFHAVTYNGRLYLFADAEQKNTFSANPELYEKGDLAEGGNCVVSQLENKSELPGSPDFEAVYGGLRYRFVSEEHRKKFLAEPKIYVDQNN